MLALTFLIIVLLVVLVFTYTNGFHDAANAIATVVSTKVLTPRQAVFMAAIMNFIGALGGVAVAKTIGAGMVDKNFITIYTVFAAMLAGIAWNILTWVLRHSQLFQPCAHRRASRCCTGFRKK